MELHPQQLEDNGFDGGAVALLEELYSWGYTDVSHSGYGMLLSGCMLPCLPYA